jgi:pilus assembly protein Flp/PilA
MVPSRRRGLLASPSKEFGMLKHLVSLNNRLAQLRSEDRGVTSVEYGLMVALIAVVIIAAVTLLGKNLSTLFNTVAGDI